MVQSLLIGKTIDNYEILELIGHGGMGSVFKALDKNLEKPVALKLMDSRFISNEQLIARFRTEGKSQARLQHRNIVPIYALRESEFGLFIVMEYIDGNTLKDVIQGVGPLPLDRAIPIIQQIVSALDHAHKQGIIHRDIKPSNILMDKSGTHAQVTDFGLARIQQDLGMTMTGTSGGTMTYASPEQLLSLKSTDHRSDIYSIGMTFYEMLTGKLPFDETGSKLAVEMAIIEGRIISPELLNPSLPDPVVQIIKKALAKEMDQRFQSAAEMGLALRDFENKGSSPAVRQHAPVSIPVAQSIDATIQMPSSGLSQAPMPGFPDSTPPPTRIPTGTTTFDSGLKAGRFLFPAAILAILAIGSFLVWQFIGGTPAAGSGPIALKIISNPAGVSVAINEAELGSTPLDYETEANKQVHIIAQKEGHTTLDTIFWASSGGEVLLRLKPATRLNIEVTPFDAQVLIDSQPHAASELINITISPGRHTIEVRKAGYISKQETINLAAGSATSRSFELARAENRSISYGQIHITSEPVGADIWLNGEMLSNAKTPYTISGAALGSHSVQLRKDGYRSYSTTARVSANNTARVTGKLARLVTEPSNPKSTSRPPVATTRQSELTILALPFGSVFVNGKLEKRNTNVKTRLELEAGKHQIRVVHPSYGSFLKTINLAPGTPQEITVDFNRFVTVNVTAFDNNENPVRSQIYVDGQATENFTPKQLRLRVGLHEVDVRRDGYTSLDGPVTVNLEQSLSSPLKFRMSK